MGSKQKHSILQIDSLLVEIVGENTNSFLQGSSNNAYKLRLVEKILDSLYEHLETGNSGMIKVESNYIENTPDNALLKSDTYIDKYAGSFSGLQEKYKPYVTPPEYAKDMAKCAIEAYVDDSREIDFGDPMVGTGTLFLALKNTIEEVNKKEAKNYKINSAIGIDIDKKWQKMLIAGISSADLS